MAHPFWLTQPCSTAASRLDEGRTVILPHPALHYMENRGEWQLMTV
jgi:hypothetical protein